MSNIPRECYPRRPHREPIISFRLPRDIFKKCVIDALEENVRAETYFTDLTAKLRAAAKVYNFKRGKK